MSKDTLFIFESSWEVCNKVGGIYTVLSTRAKTLQDSMKDQVVFIGPDVWNAVKNPLFREDKKLLSEWKAEAEKQGLKVRVGRWNVPGKPIAVLVDFSSYYEIKNSIYAKMWEDYQVDSLHAYGDYDEASMFSYAAGLVVESIYNYMLRDKYKVIYQAHEWMTGLGALYIRKHVPQIATIFTTHATSIGRSIAGNNKPLYDYLTAYNGNQMAAELNMQSKHSIERQTAHYVDCFTTVSQVTARECEVLLERPADVILMNGFESDFVPKGAQFTAARRKARAKIFQVAEQLTGNKFSEDTLIVTTSGRYEFKNKGIDVFLNTLKLLNEREDLSRPILALVEVPAWCAGPREDLSARLQGEVSEEPLANPVITHHLHNEPEDAVLNTLRYYQLTNRPDSRVQVIFVPCYLDGADGIFNMSYYDLLIGNDLCVYPSYYEPWGYTPLESVAFHIPCVTTDLSGFGMWVNEMLGHEGTLEDGVAVIKRTDYNFQDVAANICNEITAFAALPDAEVRKIRKKAERIASKALWKNFIKYYYQAYDFALERAAMRNKN